MNEEHMLLISLDEFCKHEQYTEAEKEQLRADTREMGALVVKGSKEFISLAPYMNYTLRGLKAVKEAVNKLHSIETALDYDIVCRGALAEWIALSAVAILSFPTSNDPDLYVDKQQGLSELISDMKRLTVYFHDAQGVLLDMISTSANPASTRRNTQAEPEM